MTGWKLNAAEPELNLRRPNLRAHLSDASADCRLQSGGLSVFSGPQPDMWDMEKASAKYVFCVFVLCSESDERHKTKILHGQMCSSQAAVCTLRCVGECKHQRLAQI